MNSCDKFRQFKTNLMFNFWHLNQNKIKKIEIKFFSLNYFKANKIDIENSFFMCKKRKNTSILFLKNKNNINIDFKHMIAYTYK